MAATIYPGTRANLRRLARALRRGGLVAVPTETVYGLAANALDARACRRIFRVKDRPPHDPLIIHVPDLHGLKRIAVSNDAVTRLAAAFWPGPLTLVLPSKPLVPRVVTAGLPSVAVRMPAHPLLRRLLRICDLPLAAPSANPFGYVSPTTAAHVRDGLGRRIRHILDGGPCRHGLESTIIDVRDTRKPVLLRPGVITASQIGHVLGVPVRLLRGRGEQPVVAPGMLDRHYSPQMPLVLHRRISLPMVVGRLSEAWICFRRPAWAAHRNNLFWLAASGDTRAAGRRLFALLRRLDHAGWSRLHAELVPENGPGAAINDRLRRAAVRRL